jgi:hypothetical protein
MLSEGGYEADGFLHPFHLAGRFHANPEQRVRDHLLLLLAG